MTYLNNINLMRTPLPLKSTSWLTVNKAVIERERSKKFTKRHTEEVNSKQTDKQIANKKGGRGKGQEKENKRPKFNHSW